MGGELFSSRPGRKFISRKRAWRSREHALARRRSRRRFALVPNLLRGTAATSARKCLPAGNGGPAYRRTWLAPPAHFSRARAGGTSFPGGQLRFAGAIAERKNFYLGRSQT